MHVSLFADLCSRGHTVRPDISLVGQGGKMSLFQHTTGHVGRQELQWRFRLTVRSCTVQMTQTTSDMYVSRTHVINVWDFQSDDEDEPFRMCASRVLSS